MWSHLAPLWGFNVSRLVTWNWCKASALTDFYNGLIVLALTKVIKGKAETVPMARRNPLPRGGVRQLALHVRHTCRRSTTSMR